MAESIISFRKKKKESSLITAMVNVSESVHNVADGCDASSGFITSVADAMAFITCQR